MSQSDSFNFSYLHPLTESKNLPKLSSESQEQVENNTKTNCLKYITILIIFYIF